MFSINFRLPWVQCKCSWFAVDQDSLERIQSFGRYFLSTCFVPAWHWQGEEGESANRRMDSRSGAEG